MFSWLFPKPQLCSIVDILWAAKPKNRKPVHLVRTRPSAATCVCWHSIPVSTSCHSIAGWDLSSCLFDLSSQDFESAWKDICRKPSCPWPPAFVRPQCRTTCWTSTELWPHHCLRSFRLSTCEPQKINKPQVLNQSKYIKGFPYNNISCWMPRWRC